MADVVPATRSPQSSRASRIQNWLLPRAAFARWWPVLAYATVIFILSSIPGDRYPRIEIRQADKYVHFLIYTPLGLALARALAVPGRSSRVSWWGVVFATVLGSAYGATDELHQLWTPHRSCDFYDWMTDTVSVTCAVLAWALLMTRVLLAQMPESGHSEDSTLSRQMA